jgi:hypothetical protein
MAAHYRPAPALRLDRLETRNIGRQRRIQFQFSMKSSSSIRSTSRRWLSFVLTAAAVTICEPDVAAQAFLVSSQPTDGATGVPVNTSFVFTFNTEMVTERTIIVARNPIFKGSIEFSANLTGAFFWEWDESETVLTVDYQGSLPAGELITWTINPVSSTYPLYSKDIEFVPVTSGSFTTGGVAGPEPTITALGFEDGFFTFSVGDLTPATSYRLQYSTTLEPGSWITLQTLDTTTPMPLSDETSSGATGGRYYRVITP